MKKSILAIAAAIMMSTSVMAQDQPSRQRRQFDPAEMAKQRTEMMVREYGLNEDQSAKLLDLNTRYADKMPMMMGRGPRGGQRGQRPQTGDQRPQRPDTVRQGGERPRPQMSREEMQKQMEAYNAELKNIMTEEQFQKYQDDQKRRMQQRPGERRGGAGRP